MSIGTVMDLYNVIFEGKILPGKNINTVKAEFSKLFKISSEKQLNSFFSGHPVVLKKAISLEQADKYERALLGVGAYCQSELIEKEKPVESIDFEFSQVEESPVAADDELAEVDDDFFGTTDAPVVEDVAGIEFEYGATEELETVNNDEATELEQGDEESEPVTSVSLADLSLVKLEEKEPDEERDD